MAGDGRKMIRPVLKYPVLVAAADAAVLNLEQYFSLSRLRCRYLLLHNFSNIVKHKCLHIYLRQSNFTVSSIPPQIFANRTISSFVVILKLSRLPGAIRIFMPFSNAIWELPLHPVRYSEVAFM